MTSYEGPNYDNIRSRLAVNNLDSATVADRESIDGRRYKRPNGLDYDKTVRQRYHHGHKALSEAEAFVEHECGQEPRQTATLRSDIWVNSKRVSLSVRGGLHRNGFCSREIDPSKRFLRVKAPTATMFTGSTAAECIMSASHVEKVLINSAVSFANFRPLQPQCACLEASLHGV